MTGGKILPNIKCNNRNGKGFECGGDLLFSYEVADEDRTRVYRCTKCGGRRNVT